MSAKKKILILIDWFIPGYKAGGPIQSCANLCAALNTRYDIYVLTTDTDHGETIPYKGIACNVWLYNKEYNIHIYYAKKTALSLQQLAAQITLQDADIIYLNHLFSPKFVVYPLWLKFRDVIKGKVVVCPRGALYSSALSIKSYKKKPLLWLYKLLGIHRQVLFHATNEREQEAIQDFFPGSKIIVADNLAAGIQPAFKTIIKEPGKLRCIFIARIVPIKNLLFLLQVLQQVKGLLTLTIVGPVEDQPYWNDCNKLIATLPANITVNYIGPKANIELAALIQEHHLFVLPTTGENFGHSIFEALLAGRPVLISDQTPWLQLQQKNAGWDLALNDPTAFTDTLSLLVNCGQQQFDEYAKAAWVFASDFINREEPKQQYHTLFS